MAFIQEQTAAGWRIYDLENRAIDVTHVDRAAAIDGAQAALARYEKAKNAPQTITEPETKPLPRRIYERIDGRWFYHDSDNPAKKYLETPAEQQVGSLDKKYLPVADKLLAKHGLVVPEWVRARIAKTIANMRELDVETVEVMKKVEVWNGFHTADDKFRVEITEEERPVRVEAPKQKNPYTSIPALKSACTHLVKLLEYAKRPPARKDSIPTRCASLRKALLSGRALLAVELALETPEEDKRVDPAKRALQRVLDALDSCRPLESHCLSDAERRDAEAQREKVLADHQKLVDDLDVGNVADGESWQAERDQLNEEYSKLSEMLEDDWEGAAELRPWLTRIDRILACDENRRGQPPAPSKLIMKTGCNAWRAAGRGPEYSYKSWGGREKLTGPLPDFLRDLITCCNGTHEWVKKPPSRVPRCFSLPEVPKKGDGIELPSNTAIHQDIVDFWHLTKSSD